MSRIHKAIESGKCAVAVSGNLTRDAEAMRNLERIKAVRPMLLNGSAVAPLREVSDDGLVRALQQGGVVVLIEPQATDLPGIARIADVLGRLPRGSAPELVVVGQSYNPLAFWSVLGKLKVTHEKARGSIFLRDLPAPPAEAELPEASKPAAVRKANEVPAPRNRFVGREDELAQLLELLRAPGPVVVSGPPGVGKSWLVDEAVRQSGLTVLPELTLGPGIGADTLLARLAEACKQAGNESLAQALQGPRTALDLPRLALEALQGTPALGERVMVVRDLQWGLGRDTDFFRRSRLELLLQALLCGSYPLRLVFLSTRQPTFHREGAAEGLRRLPLEGLRGKFLYEIFQAYKAPEFPRDKMGPVSERLHGHPLAVRTLAVQVRDNPEGVSLLDDPRAFKLESLEELEPLRKRLAKRVEKLSEEDRGYLARVAHLRLPADRAMLDRLELPKKNRLELLATGLLDQRGPDEDKRFQVHALVRAQLPYKEVNAFRTYARLADIFAAVAEGTTDPLWKLAYQQEANRAAYGSEALNERVKVPYPDQDGLLEAMTGLLRGKMPRLDRAEAKLIEAVAADPSNCDAWLLRLEWLQRAEAKFEIYEAEAARALDSAATPELCQQVATFWVQRRQRTRAIAYLEAGLAKMPEESRLHTRLAALLLRQGRRPEALEHLRRAMDLDPMLPDTYGLMGNAIREEGVERVAEAEAFLREAVRLAPDDATQVGRLADLLLARARVDDAASRGLRAEVKEMLDRVLKGDRPAPEAQLLYAQMLRDDGGDLERAAWMLAQCRKQTDKHHPRLPRLRVEEALNHFAQGRMDEAEKMLQQQVQRDPTDHRAFAALGHLREARAQYVVAHQDYRHAKERVPQNSLECKDYDRHLVRVADLMEKEAAGLLDDDPPAASEAAPEPAVIRRAAPPVVHEVDDAGPDEGTGAHDDEL